MEKKRPADWPFAESHGDRGEIEAHIYDRLEEIEARLDRIEGFLKKPRKEQEDGTDK